MGWVGLDLCRVARATWWSASAGRGMEGRARRNGKEEMHGDKGERMAPCSRTKVMESAWRGRCCLLAGSVQGESSATQRRGPRECCAVIQPGHVVWTASERSTACKTRVSMLQMENKEEVMFSRVVVEFAFRPYGGGRSQKRPNGEDHSSSAPGWEQEHDARGIGSLAGRPCGFFLLSVGLCVWLCVFILLYVSLTLLSMLSSSSYPLSSLLF